MKPFFSHSLLFSVVACFLVGCGNSSTTPESSTATETNPASTASASQVMLEQEPEGAKEVIDARKSAENDEAVVLVGRIGGSENPWIDGRAVFSIVDNSLKACSDIPGDGCEKPWDYCCETDKLPTATALIKVVDDKGDLIQEDARKLLNLKELQTVVVKGKAQKDDAGNFTVFADGIYVRK